MRKTVDRNYSMYVLPLFTCARCVSVPFISFESKELTNEPKELINESKEFENEPKELTNESREIAQKPNELTNESKELGNEPRE